jgi:arylsulfatase A-like enzyme
LLASFWSARISRFVYHEVLGNQNHLGRKSAAMVNAEFLKWLDRRSERPFFAFLNYMDTHTAYIPPRGHKRRFGSALPSDVGLHNYWYDADYVYSREERQQIIDAYDSCLAYLDDQLAALFAQLQQRQLDQNTLVIIVGDHGEMLGEHGIFEHANCLYSEVMRVPLMVRLPGRVAAGVRQTEPVSIADVPATVADLIELSQSPFPGVSLLDRSARTESWAERPVYFEVKRNPFAQIRKTPASDGDMQGLVLDNMYYIRNANGREEVYNLETDADQQSNLSQTPAGQHVAERSRRLIQEAQKLRPRDIN